ncbi:MAG: TetR family transcriptional regulator, partial [Cycloclasticus sp.]|nr:TetR family transcriptional regulator [Cycloclasticus sp.]
MTKPIVKNSVKTRTKILDASAALFSRHGYNGTALRDIAKALNMKAGSLYYHFDSKEQLVLEVLTIGIKNIIHTVIAEVEALPKESTSKEVMVAAAKGHLNALHEKGDYTSTSILNYGQLPTSVQEAISGADIVCTVTSASTPVLKG